MAKDLYSALLNMPSGERPPHHYALLGLPLFEHDADAIHAAVRERTTRLRRWELHPDPALAQGVQRLPVVGVLLGQELEQVALIPGIAALHQHDGVQHVGRLHGRARGGAPQEVLVQEPAGLLDRCEPLARRALPGGRQQEHAPVIAE